MDSFEKRRKALCQPERLCALADIKCAQESKGAGVYAWWIKQLPAIVPLDGTRRIGDYHLVYVGKCESAICARVATHYEGCASYSTLRKSLGVLLQGQLGLVMEIVRWPRRNGKGEPRFGWAATEGRLTEWMAKNARVVWLCCDDFKMFESSLIHVEQLPLNLKGNTRHPFYPTLRSLRGKAESATLANFVRSGGVVPT